MKPNDVTYPPMVCDQKAIYTGRTMFATKRLYIYRTHNVCDQKVIYIQRTHNFCDQKVTYIQRTHNVCDQEVIYIQRTHNMCDFNGDGRTFARRIINFDKAFRLK